MKSKNVPRFNLWPNNCGETYSSGKQSNCRDNVNHKRLLLGVFYLSGKSRKKGFHFLSVRLGFRRSKSCSKKSIVFSINVLYTDTVIRVIFMMMTSQTFYCFPTAQEWLPTVSEIPDASKWKEKLPNRNLTVPWQSTAIIRQTEHIYVSSVSTRSFWSS